MTTDYPTDEIPATPEYVLEVFRDWHRVALAANEADALSLTFETLIWEWEDCLRIEYSWQEGLRSAMNQTWCIDIPQNDWGSLDKGHGTLGDLCRLIASRATRPVIRPWRHVAGDCLPAGVFLTLRAMLVEAGEREKNITPSTRLAPYLTRQMRNHWWQFARLHPGQGPVPTFPAWVQSFRNKLGRAARVTLIALAILAFVGPSGVWVIPLVMITVMGLTIYLVERSTMFWQFQDPTIQTFRDLAYALAGEQHQRSSSAPHVSRGGSDPSTQA